MSTRYGEGPHGRRTWALVAVIGVHLALLMLVLSGGDLPTPVRVDRTLSVFAIALPPAPPPVAAPLPAPIPPPHRPAAEDRRPPPPRAAQQPAPPTLPAAPVATAALLPSPPARSPMTADRGSGPAASDNDPPASDAVGSGRGMGDGNAADGDGGVHYRAAAWLRYPSHAEIDFYWPPLARQQRRSGKVVLGCKLTRPGKPDRCWALVEEPTGIGFGDAAVRMSRIFRIRPVTRNDVADGLVFIPVIFALPAKP